MNTFFDQQTNTIIKVVLGLLGLFLIVQAGVAIADAVARHDSIPSNKTINVQGTGEAVGIPDVATFTFTVREKAKDAPAAQNAMSEKANKAIAYLKSEGIDAKDIKTENFQSNPTYANVSCGMYGCPSPAITGYEVSETVSVKVREKDKAGNLLKGVIDLKIGEVSGLQFVIDDTDALKAEARANAIEKARIQAEKIADSLGVNLSDVVSYYEDPGFMPYAEAAYGGDMMRGEVKSAGTAPTLEAGQSKVRSTVTVTFQID